MHFRLNFSFKNLTGCLPNLNSNLFSLAISNFKTTDDALYCCCRVTSRKYSIMEAAVEFQIEKTRGREEKNNDFEMIFREIGERKIRLSITLWGAC